MGLNTAYLKATRRNSGLVICPRSLSRPPPSTRSTRGALKVGQDFHVEELDIMGLMDPFGNLTSPNL